MAEDHASLQATALGWQTAFPSQELDAMGMPRAAMNYGLSKRELFAAMAMQALCTPISGDEDPQLWSYDQLADSAVKAADALLQRLAR
jgi:hypothetical protein